MTNNNIRSQIYLAALLHDIGKFVFRAQELKEGEGHELLGEQFIREHFGKIEILKDHIEKIVSESKHHKIQTYTAIADRIASAEREDEKNKNARRPLLSVLNSISLADEYRQNKEVWYFEPKQIDTKSVFAENANGTFEKFNFDEQKSIDEHKKLLNEFINEIINLRKIKSIESLYTSVYYLLYKYTTRVLSAGYYSVPDISLFDHNRAVAGLTNCLTFAIKESELNNYASSTPNKEFLYIKGDLKGIQKFIYYNVGMEQAGSTKGLSKRLRGRSFIISLFTELFANIFLEKLELSEANLLYSGGGHFNIIAPYSDETIKKVNELIENINLSIYDKLGGRINLVVGLTKCDNTLYSETGKFIQKVNFDLLQKKNKIHENYLEKIIYRTEYEKLTEKNEQEIGQKLPYTKYIVEITAKENCNFSKDKDCLLSFEKFNKYYFFFKDEKQYDEIYGFFKENKEKILKAKLIKINDNNFLEYAEKLCNDFDFPISFSFKYFGLFTPKDKNGDVMEFEEIAKLNCLENNDLSYPLLAIMRLDVDNLGSIFEFGLGDKCSFSRIASLSRELDLFFSGYFNELAQQFNVYITYSGGDDAFIVGSWLNVLHFAKELYIKFKEFVCNNKDITFSAGIFLCDENYPVAKFAQKAVELEELSKSYKDENGNEIKNAITVFDHTLSWESYCTMLDFAEKLLSYTNQSETKDKNKLNRSMVHRLLRIIKSVIKKNGSIDIEKLNRNIAQMHYLFARHGFDAERIEQAQDGITKDIVTLILKEFSKEKIIKNYLIPTNYVILKTRKIK
ncbi:MAG: type III-A CRISPR-associated protein Cas10/Csm1 [Bacteroidales bacterium]